ncbi:MAG: thermonuclease family protein [Methyloligellaceae bacterium]
MMWRCAIASLALAILVRPGMTAPGVPGEAAPACGAPVGEAVSVKAVVDSDTVLLGDGRSLRLIGALGPKAPLWWPKGKPWRAEERAREALARLVTGRRARLAAAGLREDRRGRLLAQLFVADGGTQVWVQGSMVEQGHARVYSLPRSRACTAALLLRERRARAARAGIWADEFYAVREAQDTEALRKRRYSFEIVEGRVAKVAERGRWTFVNFGADYRNDFTLAIGAKDRKRFKGSAVALHGLAGKRVRVRGWIEQWNGPVIKVTHPEQIELLEEEGPQAGAQTQRPGTARGGTGP